MQRFGSLWYSVFLFFMACNLFAADVAKKNVLLIVSDDLTCSTLSCYGSKICQSPNIDKLAAKGVRFTKAYCQFPLCNPSRASFLTGMRPDVTKVYENATQFRKNIPDVQTLGQTFQKGDYFVARVGKLYHYGVPAQIGTDGLDDPPSWQKVINPRGRDKDDEDDNLIFSLNPNGKGSGRFGGTLSWLASTGTDETHTDGLIAKAVVGLMEEHQSKPFFLACGFFRPHTPYVAPKKYFELYPTSSLIPAVVPPDHLSKFPPPAFMSHKNEHSNMTDELTRQALQAYYASTTFMDSQVKVVLDGLEKLKLTNNTIIAFTSDHGYHLGEHTLWQKQSLFENSARVPLIIYDPSAKGNGQVCERTVELVDLHATLADLAGLPPPKTNGESLKPLVDNPQAEWNHPAISQVVRNMNDPATIKKVQISGYSIRTERYRYTAWGEQGENGISLIDYQNDPAELNNLAESVEHQPIIKRHQALLKKTLETN